MTKVMEESGTITGKMRLRPRRKRAVTNVYKSQKGGRKSEISQFVAESRSEDTRAGSHTKTKYSITSVTANKIYIKKFSEDAEAIADSLILRPKQNGSRTDWNSHSELRKHRASLGNTGTRTEKLTAVFDQQPSHRVKEAIEKRIHKDKAMNQSGKTKNTTVVHLRQRDTKNNSYTCNTVKSNSLIKPIIDVVETENNRVLSDKLIVGSK